jgi:poly(A) polymerase
VAVGIVLTVNSSSFDPPLELRRLIDSVSLIARDAGVVAYVVGGTVRDVLLGRPARDLDLAVEGDAMAFARRLADALDAHYVELDDVNVVARVVLPAGFAGAVGYIDIAGLQGTLEEDLRRRDFTIDALAAPLRESAVVDVCGGMADLAAGVVRMNSPQVFESDPLRLLRAARIASELGFEIEDGTRAEIVARAGDVQAAAGERRRDELARIFALDDAYGGVRLLDELGLLAALLPEVTFGRGVAQPEQWHSYDVFDHNVRAVEAMDILLATARPADEQAWLWDAASEAFGWCEGELRAYLAETLTEGRSRASLLKLAALLHDVAKPQTRTVDDDGRVRFLGHADEGAATARRVMRRLRFSAEETRFVSKLVAEHLRPVQLAQVGEVPTRRALYRFYRALGDAVPAVLLLALADAAASRGPSMTSEDWSRHVGYMNGLLVRSMKEEGIVDPPRYLTGQDIIRDVGVPAGPKIGKLLELLREAQAAGEVSDRAAALAFVREAAGTLDESAADEA